MQAGEGIAPALPLGHVWAQRLAGWAAGQADPFPQGQVSMVLYCSACPHMPSQYLLMSRAGNTWLLARVCRHRFCVKLICSRVTERMK